MGSTQPLPNGDTFVGWGSQPFFSEYDGHGKLIFDVVLPRPDLSYRATIQKWVGQPQYPPAGAAQVKGGKTTVYASWNGATQVASWKVFGGSGAGAPAVASAAKSGFETAIGVKAGGQQFTVQALDANGRVLGTSRPFSASSSSGSGS